MGKQQKHQARKNKEKGRSKKLASRYEESDSGGKTTPLEKTPSPQLKVERTQNDMTMTLAEERYRAKFPEKLPFWLRLRIGEEHPGWAIEEKMVPKKKKSQKLVPGFVVQEVTHDLKVKGVMIKNPNPKETKPVKLEAPKDMPQRLTYPTDEFTLPPEIISKKKGKKKES